MNRFSRFVSTTLVAAAAALVGCQQDNDHDDEDDMNHDHKHQHDAAHDQKKMSSKDEKGMSAMANVRPSRAATTQPTMNNVRGTVTFTPAGDNAVNVEVNLTGLPPNSTHGFHVHEKGDLSAPDLSSAGAHWDPAKTNKHGAPGDDHVHAGDLGNVKSDSNGNAKMKMKMEGMTISGGDNGVVGKSVIVHAKADDLKSQPSGDAGGRVAGGVIEMKK
jgi:Cu-Zn family superoxide dismutase